MAQIVVDWTPLGKDVFYRKIELCSMEWRNHVNLDEFVLSAAPFGGPIALIRDEKKFVKQQGSSTKPTIHIFSASGNFISSLTWSGGRVIHFAWSCFEDLLIIQDDGTVCVYDLFGTFKYTFSMGQEAKDTRVLECKVFNNRNTTGVAILTTSFRIFVVNNILDTRIRRMPEIPGLDVRPSCWAVLPVDREQFQVPNSQILLGKESELYLLDAGDSHAQQQFPAFTNSPNGYLELAVSNDGKRVALFTSNGLIWLGSSDLQIKYCEFDTKCPNRPKHFDTPVHLVPEIDGIRIISTTHHEFFQKVPEVVKDIFRIGSMDPGAILLEANKEYQKKSHRADEYVRMIKDQLEMAVYQCIEAAGHEYEPEAASFGKCFVPNLNPSSFVDMCQNLRVLNAVRDYKLGLPLTYIQLQHLTIPVLIDRLVQRRHYWLAIPICQYLKISDHDGKSRILAHWACYKVKQKHLDDETIAIDISKKLGCTPGISYAEIASKASEHGRTQLAIKLLDYETRASEQVPLLMQLDQIHQAMTKAIESGDTDLVYFVLLHLEESLDQGTFQMEIRKFPLAQSLYIKVSTSLLFKYIVFGRLNYCKEQKLDDRLRGVHYQNDDNQAEGSCRVIECYQSQTRCDLRIQLLHSALESYKKARNDFVSAQTDEQIRLMRRQIKLEEKFFSDYLDKSLHDTIFSLLLVRETRAVAEELKKDFKMPEKHFAWMKIDAHGQLGEWGELETFSKSKKSPIGFEPFVDICLQYNNKREAIKYLPKVRVENKVKYYMKAGMVEEAANVALEMKDASALKMLQEKLGTGNRLVFEKIQAMRNQLGSK
uniref:Vacuolar protein sorting-associated protein 16 homolog n=1 Tax=Strigamia maritima TaxID=126957 RepID=T1IUZ1_STRMM